MCKNVWRFVKMFEEFENILMKKCWQNVKKYRKLRKCVKTSKGETKCEKV